MHKRKPFDQSGPFVVRGRMLMSGVSYPDGATFPMEGVAPRRLRQLWDLRRIEMAPRSIFEELMEGVKDMAECRAADPVILSAPQPDAAFTDEEIFAKAKAKTGVNYRSRARALKALESE